jgi:spore germination protein
MGEPVIRPQVLPSQPRRTSRWLAAFVIICLTLLAVTTGWWLGRQAGIADPWETVWLRAYLDRPLDQAAPSTGFWVAGYYVDYDRASFEMVKTRANHMDQVVIFGWGFDAKGDLIGQDQNLVKGLTGVQKRVLLFANLNQAGFSRAVAQAILNDPQVQARAIDAMLAKATQFGVAGIQIDFEDIAPADRQAYTNFLKRVKEKTQPKGLTLSAAVPAKTGDTRTGWGGAFDYPAIGQIVDYLYIMAYDEHWSGGPPGPVASLNWTEKVVRYAAGVIPTQKIVLGIPFYGYDWPVNGQAGAKARAFGSGRMTSRMAESSASVKWDPVAAENVATYKAAEGDRVVWFPDQRSLDAKLRVAYQYNLKGIAIWRLGFEPDDWWDQLGGFRAKPVK